MKNLTKIFALASLSLSFFACSKKVQTFQFGQPYYQAPTTAAAPESKPSVAQAEALSASTSKESSTMAPEVTSEAIAVAKSIQGTTETAPAAAKNVSEKPSFKQKMLSKYVNKKIEKLNKKSGSGLSGNLRTGVIIAAIGLLLLIIAGVGGFGGASGVFWVLGAVALIIGLVIILLEVI